MSAAYRNIIDDRFAVQHMCRTVSLLLPPQSMLRDRVALRQGGLRSVHGLDCSAHWRIEQLKLGATPLLFTSLPLSLPPFPFHFTSFIRPISIPPLRFPLFPCPSPPFLFVRLGSLWSSVSCPSGVRGGAPTANAILTILTRENTSNE